jgi:hypothetical protein
MAAHTAGSRIHKNYDGTRFVRFMFLRLARLGRCHERGASGQQTHARTALLSAWQKQGRDWLTLWGRADLAWQISISFTELENNFQLNFLRMGAHGAFTSRSPLK